MTGSALSPNITQQAGGGLLNQPGTPKISNNAIGGFQLTIFLENLESAFFQEGLMNYTQWSSGDQTAGVSNRDVVSRIAAQEEVHVASIVGLLEGDGASDVAPHPVNTISRSQMKRASWHWATSSHLSASAP